MQRKRTSFLYAARTILAILMVFGLAAAPLAARPASAAPIQPVPAGPAGVNAAPLLEENFDYGGTAGSLTAVSGGNWVAHSGSTPLVQYVTTSLTMPSYVSSGIGGSATYYGTSEDVNRSFAEQTSGTIYYAALISIPSATTTGDYFLHIKNTGTLYPGRLYAKDNGSGALLFGIATSSTPGPTYSTNTFSYNTTYLVVVKYPVGGTESTLYVLNTCVDSEPTTPLATATGSAVTSISGIAIRQSTTTPDGTVDGIRVATNWADAVACVAMSNLDMTKSATPNTNVANQGIVTYAINLENSGTAADTGVLFTDTLPAEVDFGGWINQPSGASVTADEITWTGDLSAATSVTFAFTVTHNGNYGDVVTNTAEYSGTTAGTAQAVFAVRNATSDVTLVYHDLEDVVPVGEQIYIAGSFNGWNPNALPMVGDANNEVFTATITGLPTDQAYQYKYVVKSGGDQWDWLQTADRSRIATGDETVHDYRNVTVGWANLDSPATLNVTAFQSTAPVYGQVYIQNVTNPAGEGRGIEAEVGYGSTTTPADWDWFPMTYNVNIGNNDQFMGTMTPTLGGVFSYTVRFNGNWGAGNPNTAWTYADLNGAPPFDLSQTGVMTSTQYDLSVAKTGPQFTYPGETIVYNITLTKTYDSLDTVVVTDTLPANVTRVGDNSGALTTTVLGSEIIWEFGEIGAQPVQTFQLTTTLDSGAPLGAITNQVEISPSSAGDPLPGNNTDQHTTYVVTPIHAIQGASHLSPMVGANVTTGGIVTVVRSNAFYLQDPTPDSDEATSEAVYVFTGSAPSVAVGDAVTVQGTVVEYRAAASNLTLTEIGSSPIVTVLSSGNPLPAYTVIGIGGRLQPNAVIDNDSTGDVEVGGFFDPAQDGIDFYESLECMLVQINDPLVVAPTITSFGEIAVVPDNGVNATTLSPRNTIVIQAGDFNPERILIDDSIVASEPQVNAGATFASPILGVLDYTFNNFKLFNTQPLVVTNDTLVRETHTLTPTVDQLTIATFNLENLDPSDGARFGVLAQEIVTNLGSPDIIGVQEIQDNNGATNDGTVNADVTLNTLVAAIAAAGGPTYEWRNINPVNNADGGEPGGNIRVGFLFRTDRGVSFIDRPGGGPTIATTVGTGPSGVELSSSPGRIDPTNIAFDDSRKPLAGEFLFNGRKLFVITNHFNSKGGDEPLFGHFQPPTLGSEVQRIQQATVVHDFVQDILDLDPNAMIAVVGDLNDFQFSAPLNILKTNLTALHDTLPANERYTYNYDGNAQALDHVLVSSGLLSQNVGVDVVHINSEFLDSSRPSDHDPIMGLFYLAPANVQFSASSYGKAENGGSRTITVTLDAPLAVTATVDYATSDGTAVAGTDYTAASGTLTFAPSETSKSFNVAILDDNIYEGDEIVFLDLSNPVSATLGTPALAILLIADDETEPTVQFSSATYSVGEADGSAAITVTLSGPSVFTATVDYATSNGTATSGSDYMTTNGTLTFAPGETSVTFDVTILDDGVYGGFYEGDETVLLDLSNPVNTALGTPASATLTIVDDETEPTVQLSAATYSVGEEYGTTFYEVTLSGVSAFTATVDYATSDGTAIAGTDYITASGTLIFPPGATSEFVFVTILDNNIDEADRDFNLALSNPVGASLGTPSAAVVTILDDEMPSVQFSAAVYPVGENAGTTTITVTLDATSVVTTTVDYATSDGTAIAGTDYITASGTLTFAPGETAKTFDVAILDDAVFTGYVDFYVGLSNPVNAALGSPAVGSISIVDDEIFIEPTMQFSAATYSVEENAGIATITVTVSSPYPMYVTVDYNTVNGTAIAGTDYTATSGTLAFDPGETSATFEVSILDDSLDQADHDFNVVLSNPGLPLGTPSEAVVTIVDNDPRPSVQLSAAAYTVDENAGTATITATLSAPSAFTVTVGFTTIDGTAIAGTDYTAASGTLTFAPGQTTATITVTILDNAAFSGDRALDITLSDPVEAELGTPSTATLTIVEDDPSGSVMYLPFIHK